MQTRRKVVLYGDSVVLAGVGRSLERYPRLEIVSLDALGEDAPRELDALCPAAVILDLSIVSTPFALSLLDGRPDLLLVGIDAGGNGLLVLSGQQARQLTSADLAHLIDHSLPGGRGEESIESEHRASAPAQGGQPSAQPGDGPSSSIEPG